MKTIINKFGFEIEGEFTNQVRNKLMKSGFLHYDGSVYACKLNNAFHLKNDKIYFVNEFSSYPFDYKSHPRKSLIAAKTIFNLLEDNNYHWNSSAGFHIHISFEPKYPAEILSVEFAQFFSDELTKKIGALKMRRNNNYCRDIINLEEIAQLKREKYRFINFGAALSEHGTIEFRIFPSAKPAKMYKFLLFTIKTINKFLKNDLEIPFESEIDMSENNKIKNELLINLKKQNYETIN